MGDVVVEGIKILRARSATVEVEAGAVGQLADAANVADGHIKAAHAGVAADAGKRIGNLGARTVIVEAKVEIVARRAASTASSSAAPTASGRSPKSVINPHVQVVAVARRRGHKMKILKIAGQIRRRDVRQ